MTEKDELGLTVVWVVLDETKPIIAGIWGTEQLANDHAEVMRRRGFRHKVERHSINSEWYNASTWLGLISVRKERARKRAVG